MQRLIHLLMLILIAFTGQACHTANNAIPLKLVNPLDQERSDEIISIQIHELQMRFPALKIDQLQLKDSANSALLITQFIDNNQDGSPDEFIFQTSFLPLEQKTFIITDEQSSKPIHANKTYATFVPQRKDDFAWENDRIAFRMYGPALEAEGEISSGVDVWVKSVPDLILDKWYQPGNNYHTNQGEGLDYYKVGPSRGCAGNALWNGAEMVPSYNFTDWKIIANGPLRTIFELRYAPWEFAGQSVSEVKRISLDAGSNLNRFESRYEMVEPGKKLPVAVGIVKRKGAGKNMFMADEGWFGYWEPAHKVHGSTGCGIVMNPLKIKEFRETDEHFLILSETKADKPVVYYAGAAWSGNEAFPDSDSWMEYLHNFSLKLANPIEMHFGEN